MKKIISILLLFVFLFNVTGYYFVQQVLLDKANEKVNAFIDAHQYNAHQFLELRIPLNMPYYQNTDFLRQNGQVTIKGIVYNYVERKIENGFLIVKCVPNELSQKIKNSTSDYFTSVNGIDKSSNSKSNPQKTITKSSIDDFEEINHFNFSAKHNHQNTKYPAYILNCIPLVYQDSPYMPPEISA